MLTRNGTTESPASLSYISKLHIIECFLVLERPRFWPHFSFRRASFWLPIRSVVFAVSFLRIKNLLFCFSTCFPQLAVMSLTSTLFLESHFTEKVFTDSKNFSQINFGSSWIVYLARRAYVIRHKIPFENRYQTQYPNSSKMERRIYIRRIDLSPSHLNTRMQI